MTEKGKKVNKIGFFCIINEFLAKFTKKMQTEKVQITYIRNCQCQKKIDKLKARYKLLKLIQ